VDYRKLISGVGLAAVAGLLLGGAMRPDLRGDERPEGPQIFAGWSGVRSTGPFDDGMTIAYADGQLPNYLVGSDWKQSVAWRDAPQVIEAPPHDYSAFDDAEPEPEPVDYAMNGWQESAVAPAPYPSMAGGVAYGVERSPEPPPPPAFDDEVAPEATGDTSPVVEG
jgi:hypothetical protein